MTEKKILSREDILAVKDIKLEEVNIPEWGGSVMVKSLSAAERDEFEESIILERGENQKVNLQNFRAKLVALCIVDAEGKRLFTLDDIQVLGAKSSAALDRIYGVAERLGRFKQKDVDELTKNS